MDCRTALSERLQTLTRQLRTRFSEGEDWEALLYQLELTHSYAVQLDLGGIELPIRAIQLISESLQALEEHRESFDGPVTSGAGRPRHDLDMRQLEHLIDLGFTAVDMAAIMGVSRSTVSRRLREYGLSMQRKYCAISDQDLDDIVLTIAQQYPDCGQKMMQGHLRERGIMVQQTRIRESMRRTDPYGTDVRFRTRLRRRQYNVRYPMELWHIDGNHKLIRQANN